MSIACKTACCTALAVSLAWFVGCRKEPAAAPPAGNPPAPAAEPADDRAAPAPQSGNSDAAKIEAAFAKLSVEDRETATKQKVCPVGGGPLGAMGTPIKVAVAGHDVFICCEGCREHLLEDPAKHLATIGLIPNESPPLK